MTEDLKKVGEIVYAGQTHFQFNTIYICRVQTMKLRTMQIKKVRGSVHVDTGDLSEEENSGGDNDEGKEMKTGGTIPP